MGATAVRQAEMIMTHTETVVAIELLSAAQGVDFRRQDGAGKLGVGTAVAYDLIRQHVPFITQDCYMAPLIEKVRLLVHEGKIKQVTEKALASNF
jgi:histidine ammonia-lyase